MAIVNELSSEIATAILTAKTQSPRRLNELKEIVLEVHATLRKMAETRCQSGKLQKKTRRVEK